MNRRTVRTTRPSTSSGRTVVNKGGALSFWVYLQPPSSYGRFFARVFHSRGSACFGATNQGLESQEERGNDSWRLVRGVSTGQSHECRTHQLLPLQGGGREGDGVIGRLFRRSNRRSRPIPTPSRPIANVAFATFPLKGRGRAFMRLPWVSRLARSSVDGSASSRLRTDAE